MRDLFARKRCFLTIPSSLNGGRFSDHEALESRTVAGVRLRLENAIRRLKFLVTLYLIVRIKNLLMTWLK